MKRDVVFSVFVCDEIVEIIKPYRRRVVDPVVDNIVAKKRIDLYENVVVLGDRVGDDHTFAILKLRHRKQQRVVVDLRREDVRGHRIVESKLRHNHTAFDDRCVEKERSGFDLFVLFESAL